MLVGDRLRFPAVRTTIHDMKTFLLGLVCGIAMTAAAGAGVLHRMGKLDRAVAIVGERVSDRVAASEPAFQVAQAPSDDAEPVKLGVGAAIGKPLYPQPDNPWNRDISKEPVDPNSRAIIERIGGDRPLHPDFGTVWRGAPNGIPYVVVPGDQKKVPVFFDAYANQSDREAYPIPDNPPIEGGPQGTGDRHCLILDRDNWRLYELFNLRPQPGGRYVAASGAIFDLKTAKPRPDGWTSADAAGLPILPGLVRYDEAAVQKEIRHALRFTVPRSRRDSIAPASHHAGHSDDPLDPPMGMRVRLRSTFDMSEYPAEAQAILKCLQKYGMFVADNGEPWFISGAPDPRWNNENIHAIKKVKGRDLEVVRMRN